MIPLPFGVTLLALISILVFLGLTERILDRMHLTDRTVLVLIAFMIIAHFLPVFRITPGVAINLGALVPLGIVLYLLITTSASERLRAITASIATGALLWLLDKVLPIHPGLYTYDIDPLYLGGVLAAIFAFILGRSRRAAFVGAVLGTLLVDIAAIIQLAVEGINQTTVIGGGGVFDSMLIGGVLAVGIAEFAGEIRERIYRGPAKLSEDETDRQEEGDKRG